jgi:hypothetical protein
MIVLPTVYERLAVLHERRGQGDTAICYYGRLAELWKDADPELQPRVAARRMIEALARER